MGKDGNIGKDVTTRPLRIPPAYGDYAERAQVFNLMEDMTRDLVLHLPKDPLEHMIAFLRRTPVPKIFVLGPLGSGRRELCDMLAARSGAVLLEMGEIVEAAVNLESELGQSVKPYVDKNVPIPPDYLEQLVIERVAEGDCIRNGFLLWNFPKDRKEAVGLQAAGVLPTHVILIEDATVDLAAEKMTGRLLHPFSSRIFHSVLNPPTEDMADDCVPVPSPPVEEIIQDHKRFANSVLALKASFGSLLTTISAKLDPTEMVDAVWPALTTRKESAAPWIPRVVVSGSVGSRDQEIANMLAKKYGMVAVHTQDVLQQAVSAEIAAANVIRKHLTKGDELPDSVLSELVEGRLAQLDCQTEGWVLTGYPRTSSQAASLDDAKLTPNRVFFLNVDRQVAHDRLATRRTDPVSGKTYSDKSEAPEGAKLMVHPNDRAQVIDRNLAAYSAEVDDLQEVYESKAVEIDANDPELLHVFYQVDVHLVRPREGAIAC